MTPTGSLGLIKMLSSSSRGFWYLSLEYFCHWSTFITLKKNLKQLLLVCFVFYSSGASQFLLLDFLTVKFSMSRTQLSQVPRMFSILLSSFLQRQPCWLPFQLWWRMKPKLLTKPQKYFFLTSATTPLSCSDFSPSNTVYRLSSQKLFIFPLNYVVSLEMQ